MEAADRKITECDKSTCRAGERAQSAGKRMEKLTSGEILESYLRIFGGITYPAGAASGVWK